MSTRRPAPTRRNRGVGEQTVGVHFYVPLDRRARANQVARSLGITLGRYMEILIARDEDGAAGIPAWAEGETDLTSTIPMPDAREDIAA